MDPALAKAEPLSKTGGISVITYLRKGKKCCTAAMGVRSEKSVKEPADIKVSGEGGTGDAPGIRTEFPLQSMVKDHGEADCWKDQQSGKDHATTVVNTAVYGGSHFQ